MYEVEKNYLLSKINRKLKSKFIKYKCFIAGGAITSVFCHTDIHDFDIYFRSKKDMFMFFYETAGRIIIKYVSSHAITFSYTDGDDDNLYQAICMKYYNSPEEIFDTYDFTINMGAYSFEDDKIYLHDNFLLHNLQKQLHVNTNTLHILATIRRILKYQQRGYTISSTEMMKVAIATGERIRNMDSWDDFSDDVGGQYGERVVINTNGMEFSPENAMHVLDSVRIETQDVNERSRNFISSINLILKKVSETIDYKIQHKLLYKDVNKIVYISGFDDKIKVENTIGYNRDRYSDFIPTKMSEIGRIKVYAYFNYDRNHNITLDNSFDVFKKVQIGMNHLDVHIPLFQKVSDMDDVRCDGIVEIEIMNPKYIEAFGIIRHGFEKAIFSSEKFRVNRIVLDNTTSDERNPEYFDMEDEKVS